jgi:hypothetical protein
VITEELSSCILIRFGLSCAARNFSIDTFRKHDLVLMTMCFVFINCVQKIVFQQNVTLKFIVQPLPEGAEGITKYVSFPWPCTSNV